MVFKARLPRARALARYDEQNNEHARCARANEKKEKIIKGKRKHENRGKRNERETNLMRYRRARVNPPQSAWQSEL